MLSFTVIGAVIVDTTVPDPPSRPWPVDVALYVRASGERIEPSHPDYPRIHAGWKKKRAADVTHVEKDAARRRAHSTEVEAFWSEYIPGRGWLVRRPTAATASRPPAPEGD